MAVRAKSRSYKAVENRTLCAKCHGYCCKKMPGHLHPRDVGKPPTKQAIIKLLRTGKYTVDWWEGDPRKGRDEFGKVYYLRVAAVNDDGPRVASWGGRCALLRADGCELPLAKRPTGCSSLKPSEKYPDCSIGGFSKEEAALAWIPYQDVIEAALTAMKETPCQSSNWAEFRR